MQRRFLCGWRLFLAIFMIAASGSSVQAQNKPISPTQYLAFQIFTGPMPPDPLADGRPQPFPPPPVKSILKSQVRDIVDRIGYTGDAQHRLAFIVGPLTFDYSDDQLRQLIQDSFSIAAELNIAVGFHIDDSMFWARRADLWQDSHNIEWLDWQGTPNTGRRIDWSTQPSKLAPQMCLNSPRIQQEVTHLAHEVIGQTIAQELNVITMQGRSDLFAGVIVGWETQLGRDFATNQYLGYCALSNQGFSKVNPPLDLDTEREKIVHSFIQLWAKGIKQPGIDSDKIYSHTAVLTHTMFAAQNDTTRSYSQANLFAPPEVSFGAEFHPGFSTYPQDGLTDELYAELQKHGNPTWASAEGSTVAPAILESVIKPESYLGSMFNHNATLVNLYGWGIGIKDQNPFWKSVASPDAIAAYQKFLHGQPLTEDKAVSGSTIATTLPDKIHKIQADLPIWLPKHPEQQHQIELLMTELDQKIKAGNFQDASTIADKILQLIEP